MLKLKPVSNGYKTNDANTLTEISNYNLLSDTAKKLFDNKKEVVSTEYIESANCMKVVDSIGRVAYFNMYLFTYVQNHSKCLYLVEDFNKLDLVGVDGDLIVLCAPYTTQSVEMYL